MPSKGKVLIVDDHPVVLDGLQLLLVDVMRGVQVFTAGNGSEALTLLEEHRDIDWIFLDVNLPDIDGIDLIRSIEAKKIPANIVVLSGDSSPGVTDRALTHHANGFLAKTFGRSNLLDCITTIERGGIFLAPQLKQELKSYRNNVLVEKQLIEAQISNRQMQTLKLLVTGSSNLEIAESLGIVESTVKSHIHALMTLFNAENRTHCAAEARRLNIIQ